jgi:predicted nucleotidyltransferase
MNEARRLDVAGILNELVDHSVEFILIGGTAAQLLNLPVPTTIDVDITPSRTPRNLKRLAEFFDSVHAALLTSEEGGTWFPRIPVENWSQYSTLHLLTDFGLLDIVFEPAGMHNGYIDLLENSVDQEVGNSMIRCISEEQSVEMKTTTGREKDLEHLRRYFFQRAKKKP